MAFTWADQAQPDQDTGQGFKWADQAPQAPAQAPQASPASSDASADDYGATFTSPPNQFAQALTNAGQAGSEMVQGMIPHSPEQYMKQLFPPLGAYGAYQHMRQGDFRDIPFVGSVQDIQAADQTPAFSKERFGAAGHALMDLGLLGMGGEAPRAADAAVRESMPPEAPAPPKQAPEAAPRVETAVPQPEAAQEPLQPEATGATILKPNEFQTSESETGQRDTAPTVPSPVGQPGEPGTVEASRQGYTGGTAPETSGTSNRVFQDIYGAEVPGGKGVDTSELLDSARAAISSGSVDPYSVLSRTRQKGIANPEEYAALAAEHERLVNDAVAKEKAGDPTAPEAAQQANDFANAIQPHKTAASDLFRLMQGDLNYDLSTSFGIDQYMKAELGRNMKPSERPAFDQRAQGIRQAESGMQEAVARSDVRVQRSYARVADISMEDAAARVREQLRPCQV